jgi:hypothetical protein
MSVFTFEDLSSGAVLDDEQVRSLCSSLLYGSSLPAAASLIGEGSDLFVVAMVAFGVARSVAAIPGIQKKRVPGHFWPYLSLLACVVGLVLEAAASLLMLV